MAVRSACASIARPRSRSVRSNLAALRRVMPASDDEAAGATVRAAATAADGMEMGFMKGDPEERGRDEPPGALWTERLKPVPAVLSLSVPRRSPACGLAARP